MSGRVIVVGSVNIDLVARVPHLPRPGETVTGGSYERHHGGKGGNQAVAAARLRRPTLFIGAVGDDTFEQEARRALSSERVDVSMVASLSGQPTGVALILVDATGENEIAVVPGANGAIEAGYVRECMARLGPLVGDVMLVCNEVPLHVVREALLCGQAAGATTILNPAPAIGIDRAIFGLADIVTPNRNELATLLQTEATRTGRRVDVSTEAAVRARSLLEPGPDGPGVRKAVIVTLGAAGVVVLERTGTGLSATDGPNRAPEGAAGADGAGAAGGPDERRRDGCRRDRRRDRFRGRRHRGTRATHPPEVTPARAAAARSASGKCRPIASTPSTARARAMPSAGPWPRPWPRAARWLKPSSGLLPEGHWPQLMSVRAKGCRPTRSSRSFWQLARPSRRRRPRLVKPAARAAVQMRTAPAW